MTELEFEAGRLVEHPALGIGKVVAQQGGLVHVYFHAKGGQCATKLKMDAARKLLRAAASQTHEWLDHLPLFSFDPKRGAYCLEHEKLTHEQAVGKFLTTFPEGFTDEKYVGDLKKGERAYKDAFREEYAKTLGGGEGERLLAQGDVAELRRRLLSVARINLLHFNWDLAPLKAGLADDDAALGFFAALFAAAAGKPDQARFEALVKALDAMPAPGSPVASWPIATIFPYLAQPDQHMFFRPTPTQEAAKRLAFELNYKSHPNWLTYSSVVAFAQGLLGTLRQYGAKDLIDVQSFIFVTWIPDYTT
jgi:hypothetical protein